MKLLARLVSRRVRALETTLDVQRAQTMLWHHNFQRMESKRDVVIRHLQHALDARDTAMAVDPNTALAAVLLDVAQARGERNAALKELDRLRQFCARQENLLARAEGRPEQAVAL